MTELEKEPVKNGTVDPLPIRGATPRASVGLNKKAIIVSISILSITIFFSILSAYSPARESKEHADTKRASISPGEMVKNLPTDYSAIKKAPKLGRPLNGELGSTELAFKKDLEAKALSPEDKMNEEIRLLRLKQAIAARDADVLFTGLQVSSPMHNIQSRSEPGINNLTPPDGLKDQTNARDNDNRQDDKLNYLTSERTTGTYLKTNLLSPLSPFELKAGTIIPGLLLTGINSDLPGQLLGQVSQNVYDSVNGKFLLIPQGTKLIGEYDSRISYGQERVLIIWTRLIMPNGNSISLEGMPGIDLAGYAGLHEKVDNHYWRLLGGVVFGSVLGAGAQMAQGSNRTVDPTFGQLALEGTAQNINEAGQQITRKNLNIQPTLEISPGQRFNVFVTKDIILEIYDTTNR